MMVDRLMAADSALDRALSAQTALEIVVVGAVTEPPAMKPHCMQDPAQHATAAAEADHGKLRSCR
jgi:hypothetical protein